MKASEAAKITIDACANQISKIIAAIEYASKDGHATLHVIPDHKDYGWAKREEGIYCINGEFLDGTSMSLIDMGYSVKRGSSATWIDWSQPKNN